jgi:methylenetetrahydrofolate dehydrogenase (NADP+)/methenyltetrahydrofolate cyclohydrolase
MAQLLKGKPVADALVEQLRGRVEDLVGRGTQPTLAIVRVGEREDDLSYERAAEKRMQSIGIGVQKLSLPADCAQEDLLAVIAQVNDDPAIHGCLMLRPLPAHLDEMAACEALDPAKDVDGVTQSSIYGVFANQQMGFSPCTADACVRLLDYYGYELEGARITVIGRSLVIGKPLAMMLQARNATVTMCHTHTRDLPDECRRAEIVVVAAGHIGTVGADAVAPGLVVVDVGVNWDEETERLVGDAVFDEVEPIVKAVTPVPGGVGSVTTAVLASHVVEAAERTQ